MKNRNTQAATTFSSNDSDAATWALPEGAITRLGRGSVRDMAFSPDGQSLRFWNKFRTLFALPTLGTLSPNRAVGDR